MSNRQLRETDVLSTIRAVGTLRITSPRSRSKVGIVTIRMSFRSGILLQFVAFVGMNSAFMWDGFSHGSKSPCVRRSGTTRSAISSLSSPVSAISVGMTPFAWFTIWVFTSWRVTIKVGNIP
ncbi:Hypothetical protein NTJ_04036 [Nesidiocoris tenuis]|uniref:Uncharacterized protein n=1 Tax=Nesidiocoris tenuis TaxID=355587 RepID=A0ABN7AG40_9HEMI|nr:Hypothetical protein NTJ_04036 [Nesidiocoris tenuis]